MSAGDGHRAFERSMHVVMRERVRERAPRLNLMSGVGVVVALTAIFGWPTLGSVPAALVAVIGVALMRFGYQPGPGKRETLTRPATVRITHESVAIEDEELVLREQIAQAYHQPRRIGLGTVRALDRRGRLLFELEAKSVTERNELLRALGGDVTHGRASFRVASPLIATGLREIASYGSSALLIAVGILGLEIPSVLGTAVALFVLTSVAMSIKRHVEVGVDGLLLRWLGRSRFVRYDDIRSVERKEMEVRLVLADGEHVAVSPGGTSADRELTGDALVERIEEARRTFAARASAGGFVARVGRGERGVAEWRTELARLHEGDAGYRDAAARADDLWRVVEDAGAPEDARAGAAIALRQAEGAAPRLRVAAQTVASPRLRIALEKASDPNADDEALDAALEQVARTARSGKDAR